MIKLFVFFLVIINFSLKAEDNLLTLKQQVDRLQREVNDLSKIVFQNGIHENIDSSEQNNSTDLNNITAFDIRIYDLESDIKNIYSNYEDISFQIEELKNLIEEINIKLNTKIITLIDQIATLQRHLTTANEDYPLESYGTHMSHKDLQGAPIESGGKMTKSQFSNWILKDGI